MINVISKILGRKRSGVNETNPNGPVASPKSKDSQTIWQKAATLRQSLRHTSRSKVGLKNNPSPDHSFLTGSETNGSSLKSGLQQRREFGSQRIAARERRSLSSAPKPPVANPDAPSKRSLHARSLCVTSGESWDFDALAKSTPEGIDKADDVPPSLAASQIELPRHQRSTRKLTKDSGYETSAQGDPDYINTLFDWLSEEKSIERRLSSNGPAASAEKPEESDSEKAKRSPTAAQEKSCRKHAIAGAECQTYCCSNTRTPKPPGSEPRTRVIGAARSPLCTSRLVPRGSPASEEFQARFEWNQRHRPLSFSHQEVPVERKSRQLRHSYSQREVTTSHHYYQDGHPFRQASTDSLRHPFNGQNPENRFDSLDSVASNGSRSHSLAKSTPHLANIQNLKRGPSNSVSNLRSSSTESGSAENMVTRRFKKGSVYDALASTSGLDFSPVVHLKTYNPRREEVSANSAAVAKPPSEIYEEAIAKRPSVVDIPSEQANDSPTRSLSHHAPAPTQPHQNNQSPEPKSSPTEDLTDSHQTANIVPTTPSSNSSLSNCVTSHEKYPSWPGSKAPATAAAYRSHSWTGQTDYPKEKVVYMRPKKSFKISTNQLQPVLERSPDSGSSKKSPDSSDSSPRDQNHCSSEDTHFESVYPTDSAASMCSSKPFSFETFHTPCMPACYAEKDYSIHSPPERDTTASCSRADADGPRNATNSFLNQYEEVLRQQAQYSSPLSHWNKDAGSGTQGKAGSNVDTPFLDRLRLDNAMVWPQNPPPPPPPPFLAVSPAAPVAAPVQNDIELSSENGTWMGSMESSSHGRGMPKWQGSYSDLSTLSTQLSNRSSLFDSGHSTMPESGRLSPQSSCGSTAPSLLLEGPTRAQVVARHGCHREIVAHSARVQQPERHGSESVLYYGMSRPKTAMSFNVDDPERPRTPEPVPGPSGVQFISLPESSPYQHRSQMSLTLSSAQSTAHYRQSEMSIEHGNSSPKRESRNSNSLSSEGSTNLRPKDASDDNSGSSSDVSNITCISNYRESMPSSRSWDSGFTGKKHGPGNGPVPSDDKFQANSTATSNQHASEDRYRSGSGGSMPGPECFGQGSHSRQNSNDFLPRQKSVEDSLKSRSLFGSSCNMSGEEEKRQRPSDPDLKAIQKQAVFSFYQRMSLAESIKSSSGTDSYPGPCSPRDQDPPPPYELPSPSRLRMSVPKLAVLPDKYLDKCPNFSGKKTLKRSDPGPSNFSNKFSPGERNENQAGFLNHSKSVPNLMTLKSQSLELVPSQAYHPSRPAQQQPSWNGGQAALSAKRGSPLAKEEIIPWDQLPSVLEKRREASVKTAAPSENKDPPEDGNSSSSGAANYFKGHKSPRKAQLKEVHHSNETASIKVITPDGVTLVQTTGEKTSTNGEKSHGHPKNGDHGVPNGKAAKDEKGKAPQPPGSAHHKRRPAPPPPPKQPPRRPPPPPPPESPPLTQPVVVVLEETSDDAERELLDANRVDETSTPRKDAAHPRHTSSPQLSPNGYGRDVECCPSPDLPLPPPPPTGPNSEEVVNDEPLPPPPDSGDMDITNRTLDSTSLVYPKNSYMSYRSEKKLGRQGFDGNYRRSFHTSSSSIDLTTAGNCYRDGKDDLTPSTWEFMHNIGQHGTTVIFHSDVLKNGNSQKLQRSASQDLSGKNVRTNGHATDFTEGQGPREAGDVAAPERVPSQQQPAGQTVSSPPADASPERPEQRSSDSIVIQCDGNSDEMSSSLENCLLTDDSFVDSTESDTSSFLSVDQNQNTVDNGNSEVAVPITVNNSAPVSNNNNVLGGDALNNRTNSSTQTTDTPRLRRKNSKTKEEVECERLSLNFIHRSGDIALKNLLVPSANHRSMFDYLEGLLSFEMERDGVGVPVHHPAEDVTEKQNGHWDDENRNAEKTNSSLDLKVKQINHYMDVVKNQNVNGDCELRRMRDELMICIRKKLENLRSERLLVRDKMQHNEKLGKEVTNRVQKLAKPNEVEKFMLHVEEVEKIISLLLSLSGRLAKAENMLGNLPKDASPEGKKALEAKRNKLLEQHEDACRLKESIDRRNNQVSTILHRYLTDEEYADYDYFIKTKIKLIVDTKEIDEKINLSEEQLAALKNNADAHFWKNSVS